VTALREISFVLAAGSVVRDDRSSADSGR